MSSESALKKAVGKGTEADAGTSPGAGHNNVAEFFRRAAETGRLAHAYLFVGPEGVGKSEFARALTRYLFCLNRPAKPAANALASCGQCRNCRRIKDEKSHDNFPDLHWFARQEGRRDVLKDDIVRFHDEMGFKPVEGPYKVFVVEEADRLNASSANRLLKVLEEPPAHSLILLLAEEEDDLLPTILSRVHVVRFRGMAMEELARTLVREFGAGEEEARFLARLSGGCPGLARRLREEGFYEAHERLVARVRGMKHAENFEIAEKLRAELSDAEKKRKELGNAEKRRVEPSDAEKRRAELTAAQKEREGVCLHLDGLMLAFRDELEKDCAGGDAEGAERIQKALKAILGATEAISANANTRLVLENLFFEVAGTSQGTI